MRAVIDASLAVEYLLRTSLGRLASATLERQELVAPELLDVEVLSALRRAVLSRRLELGRAASALRLLKQWPIRRVQHRRLVARAWRYRDNVSAYDAMYLAAAGLYHAPVLTADGPLSRAPNVGVEIRNLRQ